MATVPDPGRVRRPEMIDDQEKNTVFLKPLVTSPKIEVGEFTYYNDRDDPTLFESRNVLYTAGPEKLIIGRFCAIAMGAQFIMSSANHPMLGSTSYPFFIFGGTWLEKTAELLPRAPSRGDTVIGNDVWIGRDAVIMPGVTVGGRRDHRCEGGGRLRRPRVHHGRRQPGQAAARPLLGRGRRPAAAHRLVELARRGHHRACQDDLERHPCRARRGREEGRPGGLSGPWPS